MCTRSSGRSDVEETNRRRAIQRAYNEENDVTPQSIVKPIDMSLVAIAEADYVTVPMEPLDPAEALTPEERQRLAGELEQAMREAARRFEFERAAQFRDRLKSLRTLPLYEENPAVGAGGSRAG